MAFSARVQAGPHGLLVAAGFWLLMVVLQMFGIGSVARFVRYPIEWALPSLFIAKQGYFFHVYLERAVWIAFLVTFCLAANNVENETPHRDAPALGASGGLIFLMFVGISGKILFSAGTFMQVGVPAIVCAVVTIVIMKWLHLGDRMQDDSPGRGALLLSLLLIGIGVLRILFNLAPHR